MRRRRRTKIRRRRRRRDGCRHKITTNFEIGRVLLSVKVEIRIVANFDAVVALLLLKTLGLLVHDVVPLCEQLLVFRKALMPLSSGSSNPAPQERRTIFRHIGNKPAMTWLQVPKRVKTSDQRLHERAELLYVKIRLMHQCMLTTLYSHSYAATCFGPQREN